MNPNYTLGHATRAGLHRRQDGDLCPIQVRFRDTRPDCRQTEMKIRNYLSRRRFMAAGAAGLGTLGLYTWRVEPHWLQVVNRTMPVRHLPHELIGASLVHVS